ncbi:hypothetical protein MLD38_021602 [Melastoma candidum]|uniref:Uncharacterized protein n=1 Tax=Melastoma candidum TaxID=119954 RepID=A0ACB9QGK1_9MYRT|nr:hypothetical protein MLD38_021602 [Melastoma candidum]
MDHEFMRLVVALLVCVIWAMTTERRHHGMKELVRLPPGPRPLPIVGNIFQLDLRPHAAFAKLVSKYSPIMSVWLSSMGTVVVSSDDAAREMFKSHNAVLAGRKIYEAMKGNLGHEGSIITSQYGPHWRMLRRLCTTEFSVTSRLDSMERVRGRCIDGMVWYIGEASGSGTTAIDVGTFFFLMAFNLIGNLMFSKDMLDPKSERGAKFFYHAGMELAGKPNVTDFVPVLRRIDPQRIRKRTQFHVNKAFGIAGEFIEERMAEQRDAGSIPPNEEKAAKDFLVVLLEFRG